jgi:hypothetical protein
VPSKNPLMVGKFLFEYFILEEITFYPLKYLPIYTFASKVSNVTLYLSKLSNCGNSTTLTFSFTKCPYHIFYFIFKKFQKKKKTKNQKKKEKEKKYAGVVQPP